MKEFELASQAWALGLHAYDIPPPGSEAFADFFARATSRLRGEGVQPTYLGAEGEGYSGKFVKTGGKVEKKLIDSGFRGVSVLSICANPAGSSEPSYDSFVSVSLTYLQDAGELMLSSVVNNGLLPFGGPQFVAWLEDFAGLLRWNHGYSFLDEVSRRPELFVLGMDSGRLTDHQRATLNAWYAATPQVRVDRLRDVFPYTMLDERQLARSIRNHGNLRDFIGSQPGSSLRPMTEYGLHLWTIDPHSLEKVRSELSQAGALVV